MKKWTANSAFLVVMLAIIASQRDSGVLRTVRGTVVDSNGMAIASSVVYLYHQTSHAVRTYITDSSGQYRFSGLHPNADYEIHARHEDWISSVHKLFANDRKRDVVLDLKVDKKQKPRPFLLDDRPNGNMSAIADHRWSTAPEPRNSVSERDTFSRGARNVAKYEAADTHSAG